MSFNMEALMIKFPDYIETNGKKSVKPKMSVVLPYLPSDTIFCVGDGDLSFSKLLRRILKSYSIYGGDIKVDGRDFTNKSTYIGFRTVVGTFIVVLNFPHTGVFSVESNKKLLKGFFSAVPKTSSTRIHVTLKTTPPYCYWDLIGIAEDCGWRCVRSFPFPESFYRSIGYKHTTTKKLRFEVNLKSAMTYEFVAEM